MQIYNYDDNGLFISETEARQDPMVPSEFLIPRNATTVTPPTVTAPEVLVFNGTVWEVKEDHRGTTIYSQDNKAGVIVTDFGPIPVGYVTAQPATEFDNLVDGVWVTDTVAQLNSWRNSTSCGPLQFRKALRQQNLMVAVKNYIDTVADEETVEAWEYATTIKRMDPMVLTVIGALGYTSEQADELFQVALTFE